MYSFVDFNVSYDAFDYKRNFRKGYFLKQVDSKVFSKVIINLYLDFVDDTFSKRYDNKNGYLKVCAKNVYEKISIPKYSEDT